MRALPPGRNVRWSTRLCQDKHNGGGGGLRVSFKTCLCLLVRGVNHNNLPLVTIIWFGVLLRDIADVIALYGSLNHTALDVLWCNVVVDVATIQASRHSPTSNLRPTSSLGITRSFYSRPNPRASIGGWRLLAVSVPLGLERAAVALTFCRALETFRLTFMRMRDICTIINVQRKDKASVV